MTNKILRSLAVLALYGGLSQVGYCSTSGGLSSSIDSEGFTAEQKRALHQQTAMAKLGDPEPLLSSTILDEKKSSSSTTGHIKVNGDISVLAGTDSKAAIIVGKNSTDIEIEKAEVSAEEKSKAVAILNKSGGMNSDIKAENISVKATGNSQAYGFVDDASDW